MSNDNTDSRDTIIDVIQPYDDQELDAAMRELEAIEAADRDLKTLRGVWASRLLAVLAGALTLVMSSAALADGPAKAKRPAVCLHGTPVSGDGFKGYMCLDGKRPRLFTRYIEVRFVDDAGKAATYVLGWTGAKQSGVAPVSDAPLGGMKL